MFSLSAGKQFVLENDPCGSKTFHVFFLHLALMFDMGRSVGRCQVSSFPPVDPWFSDVGSISTVVNPKTRMFSGWFHVPPKA